MIFSTTPFIPVGTKTSKATTVQSETVVTNLKLNKFKSI